MCPRSGLENGKFLVRSNSSSNNPQTDSYKISLCYNNEIKHYKIKTNVVKSEDGGGVNTTVRYSFEGGLEFESITQLVDYYHRCADGLAYTLRTPFIPHTRIDPVLLSFLTAASNPTNGATTKTNVIHNPLALSLATSPPPLPATTTITVGGGGSSSSNSGNNNSGAVVSRKITSMLHNEAIYDSNRMYEVIMNQRHEAALNFDQNSGKFINLTKKKLKTDFFMYESKKLCFIKYRDLDFEKYFKKKMKKKEINTFIIV